MILEWNTELLRRGGYELKILNTINFKKSMKYNPFEYIRSEKDILKLVTTLIANTKGDGEKAGEDFWVKAEKLYYTALIGYIFYEGQDDEKNFITLLDMINASEAREDDEEFKNPVDLMFESLEKRDPEHFAVLQYKKYKMAAGLTYSNGRINQPLQSVSHSRHGWADRRTPSHIDKHLHHAGHREIISAIRLWGKGYCHAG